MQENFQDKETRDNNIEYNSLVFAYRIAYLGISAREATQKEKPMWTELKERYVMGMLCIGK